MTTFEVLPPCETFCALYGFPALRVCKPLENVGPICDIQHGSSFEFGHGAGLEGFGMSSKIRMGFRSQEQLKRTMSKLKGPN